MGLELWVAVTARLGVTRSGHGLTEPHPIYGHSPLI
jgi:hypothetical protein